MGKVYEGKLDGSGLKVGIVVSRFNDLITSRLLDGALDRLRRSNVPEITTDVCWVPGAFEVPRAAKQMAETGRYDGIIALAAVIRGSTPHFDYVASEVSKGARQGQSRESRSDHIRCHHVGHDRTGDRARRNEDGQQGRSSRRDADRNGERPERAGMTIDLVRGMYDILPDETAWWRLAEDAVREMARRYNYREIRTPARRAYRAVQPRHRRGDGRGREGDVHVRRPPRPQPDAPSGGHRLGLPRLLDPRMADERAVPEALLRRRYCSATRNPRRGAIASSTSTGSRCSARSMRASMPR